MRIDKMIGEMGIASRREIAMAARKGEISVNGVLQKNAATHINPLSDRVVFCGEVVQYVPQVYVMLDKPKGFVSATDDLSEHTVTELLPERLQKRNLFPCGRLDKYTTGLVLMTNDGELAHRLLAPKTHVEKVYTYVCETALGDEETEKLEAGVYIEGGYRTKPCFVFRDGEYTGRIAITEGKYHQIKQMFSAVGNRIVELRRIRFGSLCLDENLGLGGWRMLRPEEVDALRADAQKN